MRIRLTATQKAWIAYQAAINNRSQNAEIQSLLDAAIKTRPLKVYVHECGFEDGKFFGPSVGELHPFIEDDDREKVVVAARAKAKDLGLARSALAFEVEVLAPDSGGRAAGEFLR